MAYDPTPIDRARALDAQQARLDLTQILPVPDAALHRLDEDIAAIGGAWQPDPANEGAVGFTMFDSPTSNDNSLTVLLADERIAEAPSQSLVRIRSKDGRSYLGTIVAGPFAEPDGLRADSSVLVTVVTRGGIFVPPYHGRVQVDILGEERDGALVPPRYRPLPNSPAFVLGNEETARVLQVEGDIQLGQVVGREEVVVSIPSTRKDVLPRHTAIIGTTGGGKSTSVARLVHQAQAADCAVVLLDVEGEYTFLHEPTTDDHMLASLERRKQKPSGVRGLRLYHLVGREAANPDYAKQATFSLQFARLSPYTVMEILNLTDAQRERFMHAYDMSKVLLRELGVFPERGDADQEQRALEVDEFDRGYPRLRLSFLMDVVSACRLLADKADAASFTPSSPELRGQEQRVFQRIASANVSGNPVSWRALLGKLAGLYRLKVFDRTDANAKPLVYELLLRPGTVSVIDLSDSGSPVLNNLVIADLLRGIQEAQEDACKTFETATRQGRDAPRPTRALVVIEEAHEFLSAERIDKMPVLFEQVTRIARRGRKRWLGLVFVTQLPQHLPRQLFGLVNSYILHKISDPQVIATLQRTVSGIDESLWRRLPGLAPGQAIVAFPHLARPLLVAVDPAPCRLRLVD